jgi:hypothetical protein
MAGLTGCGKSNKALTTAGSTALTPAQANDAASQVGALFLADGSGTAMPAGLMAHGVSGLARARRTGPMSTAAETTIVANGVTWSFALHWYNLDNVEQLAFDPVLTARMVADSHGSGMFTGPDGSVSIGSAAHLDVSGISSLQDTLRTNASRADTLDYAVTLPNGAASLHARCSGVYANVVEAKPADGNYPARGSAAWSLDVTKHVESASGNVDEHFLAAAVVTFNGTHLVPLVVNGLYHYTLDLDTGIATPVTV